jgi:hypothetical protein
MQLNYKASLKKLAKKYNIFTISIFFSIVGASIGWCYPNKWIIIASIANPNSMLTLPKLRYIKESLPIYAKYYINAIKKDENTKSLFNTVADPEWVEKNITPNYSISKNDVSDLFSSTSGTEVGAPSRYSFNSLTFKIKSSDVNQGRLELESILKIYTYANYTIQFTELLEKIIDECKAEIELTDQAISEIYLKLNLFESKITHLNQLNADVSSNQTINYQFVVADKEVDKSILPISIQKNSALITKMDYEDQLSNFLRRLELKNEIKNIALDLRSINYKEDIPNIVNKIKQSKSNFEIFYNRFTKSKNISDHYQINYISSEMNKIYHSIENILLYQDPRPVNVNDFIVTPSSSKIYIIVGLSFLGFLMPLLISFYYNIFQYLKRSEPTKGI